MIEDRPVNWFAKPIQPMLGIAKRTVNSPKGASTRPQASFQENSNQLAVWPKVAESKHQSLSIRVWMIRLTDS